MTRFPPPTYRYRQQLRGTNGNENLPGAVNTPLDVEFPTSLLSQVKLGGAQTSYC